MRRSLASGSRAMASHASRARAGRSRQRQSKWAGSTRRCTRTALVTAPFLFGTIPAFSAPPNKRPEATSARSNVLLSPRATLFPVGPTNRPGTDWITPRLPLAWADVTRCPLGVFLGRSGLTVQNARLLDHAREVRDRLFIDDRRLRFFRL